MSLRRIPRSRRGLALVYVTIAMTIGFGIGSLALDLARVQMVKTELQRAADAAARAAVNSIGSGIAAAQNAAITVASQNNADGSPIVLDPTITGTDADIEFGSWDGVAKTFSVLSGASRANATAMRITARREQSRGNGVPLVLASALGVNYCNAKAVSIAMVGSKAPGITGLSSVDFHNQFFDVSYNSSSTTTPSHTNYTTLGWLASNGSIGAGTTGNALSANVILGPNAVLDSHVNVSGSVSRVASDLTGPADPTFTPIGNPGGVSATPSVSGAVTWAGGDYYFTSLTMASGATITFTGPANIYLNGNATLNSSDTITAYQSIPTNLKIYQATGKSWTCVDSCNFCFVYQGCGASFTVHDFLYFTGGLIAKTLTLHDKCDMYYDETLGSGGIIGGAKIVK